MPNHLSHSLSPLLFCTSFLLVLLTFTSPSTTFKSSVSLLRVSGNGTRVATSSNVTKASASNSTTGTTKRWMAIDVVAPLVLPKRMTKVLAWKRGTSNTTSSTGPTSVANSTSTSLEMVVGPMGACLRLGTGPFTCRAPSFTPIFTPVFSLTSIPTTLLNALPLQFPLAPTALFLGLLFSAVALLFCFLASLPFHAKKLVRLQKRQLDLTKVTIYAGGIGLVFGLVATVALRLQLGDAVDAFAKAAKAEGVNYSAELGTGFNQFWAGWALGIVAVICSCVGLVC